MVRRLCVANVFRIAVRAPMPFNAIPEDRLFSERNSLLSVITYSKYESVPYKQSAFVFSFN